MKPWEKPCLWIGHRAETKKDHECLACHGTGVVAMSTDEMLEALLASEWCLEIGVSMGDGLIYVGTHGADNYQYGLTPADALRAALRAVNDG